MTDDSRLSDYVAADEGQDERLRESLAAWTSCSEGGHVRQHIISEAVRHIDSLDASDPEHAHGKLNEWLLVFAPTEVRKAAARLMGRCDWWAGA